MSIERLKTALPATAKDIKLNLSSVLTEEGSGDLNQKQIFLITLASAYATKNTEVVSCIRSEIGEGLTAGEIEAAQSSAIIMAMNNIYYRFIHLTSDKSFSTMPAKLRMNVIAQPGIAKADFELCCLAVSAINGCGLCIDSHTQELIKHGISKLAIQSTIRIASVVNATAMGIEIAKF